MNVTTPERVPFCMNDFFHYTSHYYFVSNLAIMMPVSVYTRSS